MSEDEPRPDLGMLDPDGFPRLVIGVALAAAVIATVGENLITLIAFSAAGVFFLVGYGIRAAVTVRAARGKAESKNDDEQSDPGMIRKNG